MTALKDDQKQTIGHQNTNFINNQREVRKY
jgi:hypothetical protein